MGNDEIASGFREKLQNHLESVQFTVANGMFVCRNRGGFGRLTITFQEATAESHTSGRSCDIFDPCDPYIKFFINNEKVYQTEIYMETPSEYFDEIYTSHVVNRKSPIRIEM